MIPELKKPSVMLDEIKGKLMEARRHLRAIDGEVNELTRLGVFEDVPRFDWQTKGGSEYLYLWFPRSKRQSGWSGPDGRHKLYIGRSPGKVQAAAEMTRRTRRVQALDDARVRLKRWITEAEVDVMRLHRRVVVLGYPVAPSEPGGEGDA